MRLSSIQLRISGTILLLLLMWENVACVPRCVMKDGGCQKVLSWMFNMTSTTAETISRISSDTLNEFDAQYDPGQKFLNRPTMICHTASRSIPNSKRKAERMKSVDLLNVTIRILAAWKNLLYHVKNNMADLDGTPYATTVKVEFLDGQIKRLTKHLQGIKTILSQVHPELKENENYPAWSGEPYVQQSRRGIQLFGLHSLFFCLHSDAQKVSDFVSILRHQIVPNK
ncbi:prolactin-5A1-like [Cricetulus griseus]|uniref:Prolactin-5A1-like n=1 Tax=Cricetulus griseus TaxID=10029 RepID=A0A9J7JEC1_CRIGR|nr:prolactin-5A1-like [Cricetulus griseus]XP_027265042.1 prolactin-5A1-like [Cricetulus griseus]